MKNLFSLIFLLFIGSCIGQTMDHVVFDYDNAGNQVKRHLVDLDSKQNTMPVKDIKDITESDLIKADIYDDIKYYPNPVKDELYLKWELVNDNKVRSISLYNLNGQLLRTVNNLEKDNSYTFSFQQLPQGIFNLILNYSTGEKKSLKIIKH